jgi:hypothetical protein
MPSNKDRNVVRARVFDPEGAGGEPPAILDGVPRVIRDQLSDEVVDELLGGAPTEQEIAGQGGVLAQLTQRLIERALEVELTDHPEGMSPIASRRVGPRTPATGRRRRG